MVHLVLDWSLALTLISTLSLMTEVQMEKISMDECEVSAQEHIQQASVLLQIASPREGTNPLEVMTGSQPCAEKLVYPKNCKTTDGDSCVFGVDQEDEGAHCIPDFSYGPYGYCYTKADKSTWGKCRESCPLFGRFGVLDRKVGGIKEKLDALMQEVENITDKGCCGKTGTKVESKGPSSHGGKDSPVRKAAAPVKKEAVKNSAKGPGHHGGKTGAAPALTGRSVKMAKKAARMPSKEQTIPRRRFARRNVDPDDI
jgi:hypothetical protein